MCSQRVFGANQLERGPGGTLVAIGNFDGVHRGHRAVLSQALRLAKSAALAPLVLTFDPHPAAVVGRGSLPALTPLSRKLSLICRQGPELTVVVEPFTRELGQTSARTFVEQLLVQTLGARLVLVGENFRFGSGRQGDFALLSRLGTELGFEAHAATLERDELGAVSSTRIRRTLEAGDLPEVERLLGRPHSISGQVRKGDGRGRSIGVPTANLFEIPEALPPHGVYAVLVDRELPSGEPAKLAAGVANFGVRPTLAAGPSFEVHLFDFEGDLYDARLRVHLAARLRDERKFAGVGELVAQIQRDIAEARAATRERKPDPSALGAWY